MRLRECCSVERFCAERRSDDSQNFFALTTLVSLTQASTSSSTTAATTGARPLTNIPTRPGVRPLSSSFLPRDSLTLDCATQNAS